MTPDDLTVLSTLEAFVRKRFEIPADDPEFTADVHLFDYGYLDSFGAQELIAYIESTYKIAISDDDLVKYPMNTLNEIAQFIIKRRAHNA